MLTRSSEMLTRSSLRLCPDPRRVLAVPFVPGEEMPEDDSRAASVADRIMAMDDDEVTATLDELERHFARRHRQLAMTWSKHFRFAARRLEQVDDISPDRALLIGAYFTREISIEAVAVFSPSMVAHPDQTGLGDGEERFVMSLRALSEGHVSSIEFRTGVLDAAGNVSVDQPGAFVERGQCSPGPYKRRLFHAKLAEYGCDNQTATLVLDRVGDNFGLAELESAIGTLHHDLLSRAPIRNTVERIRWVAANNYTVEFAAGSAIAERVVWPNGPSEVHGMEDARFVRFVDDAGGVSYIATYTAFDSAIIAPQLLSTTDFRTFVVSQLSGAFATDKGMALFPRKVGGRYLALSRWDRETLGVTVSDNGDEWAEATTLVWPPRPWELVQVGNCGPPIETGEGWLVLTHGVGAMRTYVMGAILLDLEDPRHVIATLRAPLLEADEDEREGYVPNVVYSCGGLVHGQTLVVPYGFSDTAIGFARVDLADLLDRMTSPAMSD
jgi:predicted GH43/DUF377 family glycosyl hydrolase